MQERSEACERLVVAMETSHGSGEFRVDPRLRVEEVSQACGARIGSARVSVLLDDEMDGEEVRRLYHPDRRLIVTTEGPDPRAREILFEGFPPVQVCRWDGRIGREGEQYVFEAEHVWGRYNRDRSAWIYGRRMRNGAIEEGLVSDPAAFASQSALITAMPCVFNADGAANQAIEPLLVAAPDGGLRLVHVFAVEGQPAAKWTYATALRYLVWFHLERGGPVGEGNTFAETEALAAGDPSEAGSLWAALVREPVSLNCEAVTLVEALGRLTEAAGVHVTAETFNDEGRPRTQLRLFSPRGGACRKLHLVRGGRYSDGVARYDASTRSAREVLADNNTYRGQVAWDHRPVVNHAVVIGDVKRYELTVPLWPGWRPTASLDNVAPESRTAAKMLALTPDVVSALGENVVLYDWYRRYHRDGAFHHQHSDVGRLWVLNEDGSFDASTYNRNPPFDVYKAFDFSTVLDRSETQPGSWSRRVRPFAPSLTRSPEGRSLGVHVEVSFNSGVTWVRPNGEVSVLAERAAIHFDCDNPTQIVPPGVLPPVQNMWYAIVDQTFRVRVTAVIEGDDRLMATFGPQGLDAPTVQVNGRVIHRSSSLRFASRRVGSSIFRYSDDAVKERDDSAVAANLAVWLARSRQDRDVRVAPAIPWIETGYAIGERISEIAGRYLRFATTSGADMQYPCVVERRFVLQDERYDTVLTLEAADLPEGVV